MRVCAQVNGQLPGAITIWIPLKVTLTRSGNEPKAAGILYLLTLLKQFRFLGSFLSVHIERRLDYVHANPGRSVSISGNLIL